MEIGRLLGRLRIRKVGRATEGSFVAVEGAVFGLMGLLIAFTFSAAATRFETRRQLAVEETNDIGTAWKRLDLLPASRQAALREDFRQYVDTRLAVYRDVTNRQSVLQSLALTKSLQDEIWSRAVTACEEVSSPAITDLVITSLNAMIDITTTRTTAAQMHLPVLIRDLLIVLPLVCALLAGLDAASLHRRSPVHMLGFALVLSITIFVILDLDYPRVGLIRIDVFDQSLVDLRKSM